jgi:hypothetical protein
MKGIYYCKKHDLSYYEAEGCYRCRATELARLQAIEKAAREYVDNAIWGDTMCNDCRQYGKHKSDCKTAALMAALKVGRNE